MSADEAPEVAEPGPGRRGISMWFLAIPVALAVAAAALAFFLLSPRDDDLMGTPDDQAVAVAVANAQPAKPAYAKPPPRTPAAPEQE